MPLNVGPIESDDVPERPAHAFGDADQPTYLPFYGGQALFKVAEPHCVGRVGYMHIAGSRPELM